MGLTEKIDQDIRQAMLTRDAKKLEALRAIKSALLLAKTDKKITVTGLSDHDELSLLQRLVKQRKESAAIYREQNRTDLAEPEEYQAMVIEAYLPEQLSTGEIRELIAMLIKETGAGSMKDMGRIMGLASKQLAGKADNKTISQIVKEMLG